MKKILLLLMLFSCCFSYAQDVYVNGYTKSNGTYVQGYYRTAPNSTVNDNYSTIGNVNPYTGKAGYLPRDNGYSASYVPISPPSPVDISDLTKGLYSSRSNEQGTVLLNKIKAEAENFHTDNSQNQVSTVKGKKYFINDNGRKNYIVQSL